MLYVAESKVVWGFNPNWTGSVLGEHKKLSMMIQT